MSEDFEKQGFFQGGGMGKSNTTVIALFVLLGISLVIIFTLINNKYSLDKSNTVQKNQISGLQADSLNLRIQLDSLFNQKEKLKEEADSLLREKDKIQNQKDSVSRLLYAVRGNANASKGQINKLQKQLKDLQDKYDKLQKDYDELVSLQGTTLEEYKKQITELDGLVKSLKDENAKLRSQSGKVTEEAENMRTLSVINMVVSPGYLDRKNRFQLNFKSKNIEVLEIKYTLSRAPRSGETIEERLYGPDGEQIALTPRKKGEVDKDPIVKDKFINPTAGYKFQKGRHEVAIVETSTGRELRRFNFELN